MTRTKTVVAAVILALGGMFLISATATFDNARLNQPATVIPPTQADNGVQTYWGMCMSCHGDLGQGLTDEWRKTSFDPGYQDCWKSGCHGSDAPKNSFEIPATGAPALAGSGALARFSNSLELYNHIQGKMPFSPAGSLSAEQAWALTATILRMNNKQPGGLTLNETNGAAIPLHRKVDLPENEIPGALILTSILLLSAVGLAFRTGPDQAKQASQSARPNFFHHLHPARIPEAQARFLYTLGAGGIAVFLSMILLLTGLLEMYYYIPTPQGAPVSVQTITTLVPFGNLVRNLHFWSAQFLVIVITVHLLRVVLTGSYAPPRHFNYVIGLGLLVFILLLNFTGYMLRWDEGIHWALTVGTNLLKTIPWVGNGLYQFAIGGTSPGSATLTRFYTWHIFGLTLGVVILVAWHAFRVRRDGGIAAPSTGQPAGESITRFDLVKREVLAMVVAGLVLLLFCVIFPAPIGAPISGTNLMPGDSRAPWFFLWIQELLKAGDPFFLGVVTPALVVVVLALLPTIFPNAKNHELGCWLPAGNRVGQVITVVILLTILFLTIKGSIR